MSVRIASPSWVRWGRSSLVLALCGLPLYASCTTSEDTEPYIRATPGSEQGEAGGGLLSEDDACGRLRKAAEEAYDRLNCDAPSFPECPSFVRPGGGSGCYEYPEDGVAFCEQYYDDARSCRELSVCSIVAVENQDLSTCELVVDDGAGGAGGAAAGGAPAGGATAGGADAGGAPTNDGGVPGVGGSDGDAGAPPAVGGAGGAG